MNQDLTKLQFYLFSNSRCEAWKLVEYENNSVYYMQ